MILIIIFRESMFYVCRELQSVFNEERERTMKTISFTKTLRKDICCKNSEDGADCIDTKTMDDIKVCSFLWYNINVLYLNKSK